MFTQVKEEAIRAIKELREQSKRKLQELYLLIIPIIQMIAEKRRKTWAKIREILAPVICYIKETVAKIVGLFKNLLKKAYMLIIEPCIKKIQELVKYSLQVAKQVVVKLWRIVIEPTVLKVAQLAKAAVKIFNTLWAKFWDKIIDPLLRCLWKGLVYLIEGTFKLFNKIFYLMNRFVLTNLIKCWRVLIRPFLQWLERNIFSKLAQALQIALTKISHYLLKFSKWILTHLVNLILKFVDLLKLFNEHVLTPVFKMLRWILENILWKSLKFILLDLCYHPLKFIWQNIIRPLYRAIKEVIAQSYYLLRDLLSIIVASPILIYNKIKKNNEKRN